ncbi:unnamed protein product [Trichobilharzia regenti]|nr:unnamed protein product [Trichobilharzia regenti]
MTGVQSVGLDSRDGTLRNGTMTSVDTDWTDRDPAVNAKLDRIDAEIETLKRLGESSGITAVSRFCFYCFTLMTKCVKL